MLHIEPSYRYTNANTRQRRLGARGCMARGRLRDGARRTPTIERKYERSPERPQPTPRTHQSTGAPIRSPRARCTSLLGASFTPHPGQHAARPAQVAGGGRPDREYPTPALPFAARGRLSRYSSWSDSSRARPPSPYRRNGRARPELSGQLVRTISGIAPDTQPLLSARLLPFPVGLRKGGSEVSNGHGRVMEGYGRWICGEMVVMEGYGRWRWWEDTHLGEGLGVGDARVGM